VSFQHSLHFEHLCIVIQLSIRIVTNVSTSLFGNAIKGWTVPNNKASPRISIRTTSLINPQDLQSSFENISQVHEVRGYDRMVAQ